MTQAGLINGYVMKDIRLSYDAKTDTLAVGVNFYGIAGNTDGSPDGGTNPQDDRGGRLESAAHRRRQVDHRRLHARHRGRHQRRPGRRRGRPRQQGRLARRQPRRLQRRHRQRRSSTSLGHRPGLRDHADQQPRGPGLRPLAGPPRLRVHHQELQQDPRPQRPDQRLLHLGLRRDREPRSSSARARSPTPWSAAPLQQPQNLDNPPADHRPSRPRSTSAKTPEPTTILAWGLVAGGAGWRVRRRIRPSAPIVIRSRTDP